MQLFPFVFFSGIVPGAVGFWDFFGPLILALTPLLILASRSLRSCRIPLTVWVLSAMGIFSASGLPRFLLPVFPLALVCIAAGLTVSETRGWKVVSALGVSLTVLLCAVGAAGLGVYGWRAVAVAVGAVPRTQYLEARRPEYQEGQAINGIIGNQPDKRNTLVFVRHMYSLEVPFLNGDPATSWIVNPDRLRTPQEWKLFFRRYGISFVVRSPEYPEAVAKSLSEMEETGQLTPVGEAVVQDFQGMRIQEQRVAVPVVVLRVKDLGQ